VCDSLSTAGRRRTTTRTLFSDPLDRRGVTLDRLDLDDFDPDDGEIQSAEVVVTDDVLVKAFALGPGATLDPHEHGDSTNVFHVIRGEVTVLQGDDEERVSPPGVVLHERGVPHGARNDGDGVAVFTASLCPLPGSG
jgi:quercetin dioxygenase-like cupin family protein